MPYRAGLDAGGRARDVRRELVEHGAVIAVVTLPARMFPGYVRRRLCLAAAAADGTCCAGPARGRAQARPATRYLADGCTRPRCGGHRDDSRDGRGIGEPARVQRLGRSRRDPGPRVLAVPAGVSRPLARPDAADAARAELDALFEDFSLPPYTTGRDAGWPRHRLGDICDIRTGVPHDSLKRAISRARTAREAVPVVHPRHLRDGLIQAGDAPDADVTTLERVPTANR